jgi:hypothetical protein
MLPSAVMRGAFMVAKARFVCAVLIVVVVGTARAGAADRWCDSSYQNCRTPLLDLIKRETIGIDVAFWFMEDQRYTTALIARWKAGVPVRVLIDTKANASYPANATIIRLLKDAGIPIREKTSSYLHWKTMIFAGQHTVEFSGANYSSFAFVPVQPYVDFIDEVIYFSDDARIVNSFKTRFDDVWVSTNGYRNYANITGTPTREYGISSIDSRLNFEPWQNFGTRSVARYNAETRGIDTIMFRITDRRHSDAMIAARKRGVPVRIITEPLQYRDRKRYLHAVNVDKMYMAGIKLRHRAHRGSLHQKTTILHGQGLTIFGSANWATTPGQLEHNFFTTSASFFNFMSDLFDRKWFNSTGHVETTAFVPLAPDPPAKPTPASGATRQPLTVTLKWYSAQFAHFYDVYIGTDKNNLRLVLSNANLGPCGSTTTRKSFTVQGLSRGRTYYWKVVSRTYAKKTRTGPIWSFST